VQAAAFFFAQFLGMQAIVTALTWRGAILALPEQTYRLTLDLDVTFIKRSSLWASAR
jgi:hypothetical protein